MAFANRKVFLVQYLEKCETIVRGGRPARRCCEKATKRIPNSEKETLELKGVAEGSSTLRSSVDARTRSWFWAKARRECLLLGSSNDSLSEEVDSLGIGIGGLDGGEGNLSYDFIEHLFRPRTAGGFRDGE